MVMRWPAAVLLAASVLVSLSAVAAHTDHGGIVVGDYVVALSPSVYVAGRNSTVYVLIDFSRNMTEASGLEVYARLITPDGSEVFSEKLKEIPPGIYYFTYLFSETGDYTLRVRIEDTDASLTLSVVSAGEQASLEGVVIVVVGLVVLASVALYVRRMKRRELE